MSPADSVDEEADKRRPWRLVAVLLIGLAAFGLFAEWSLADGTESRPPSAEVTSASATHDGHGTLQIDSGFAQDMIVHHQQAVTLSDIAILRGPSRIRSLAEAVKANQLLEIGQMQGLLSAWGQPWMSSDAPMAWMGSHDGHEGSDINGEQSLMPGMATMAEIEGLQVMSGPALVREYLRLMIRHHQGAIPMTSAVIASTATEPVLALAQRMAFEQTIEIALMRNLRATLR